MTDTLRAALSADEDTPAGVDVAAVRVRAGRLRRTRYAAAGAAVVTALAVLVPVAVLRPDRVAVTAVAPAGLSCPDRLPGAPFDGSGPGDLLPGPATGAVLCTFADFGASGTSGPLAGVARLTAAEARVLAARLAAARPAPPPGAVCTSELSVTFAIRFAGPAGPTTLRVETYGCAKVSNGTVTRLAGVDKAYLRQLVRRAAGSATCPVAPPSGPDVAKQPAGPALLPAAARRLVLCAYLDGALLRDVALQDAPAQDAIARLDAAPAEPPGEACGQPAGGRQLVLLAVAPDGVRRAVADLDACGGIRGGTRVLRDFSLVQELYERATR